MPVAWRTVRVFISSTFRDMQAERDHLVRFVFPRLREDSVCRDEVALALVLPRTVVPARASNRATPTPQLVRRSWVDFTRDYDDGLRRLLEYLGGDEGALLAPELATLTESERADEAFSD